MKKYASLLLFALLLNGCDDGDLMVDTINFEDILESQSCPTTTSENTLIYKLKPQEALMLQMPKIGGLIEDDTIYTRDINNSTFRVVYRAYDGAVVTNNICSTIPPSTPKVTEEWLATNGKINITSAALTTTNDTDGSSVITGYSNNIEFTNITFAKSSSSIPQTNILYKFGTYSTTTKIPASLIFRSTTVNMCPINSKASDIKQVYNYNNSFYISIENISSNLIVNQATEPGKPRTALISATNNKVFYRTTALDTGTLTDSYFCNSTPPVTPAIDQEWSGQLGVANVSGIIEVTTESAANIYTHKIVLKNVIMGKNHSKFKLGTSFVLGTLTTLATP